MSAYATAGNTPNRWVQLWLGVLCMGLIANLQYAWTLFVNPIHQAHGWSIAEIQVEVRPGTRIAFLKSPDGVLIELLERS